jgi:hypothetical protein
LGLPRSTKEVPQRRPGLTGKPMLVMILGPTADEGGR